MKRKAAIICPIKDETTYIHKFFEYYQRHFEIEDIYILDFGSNEEYIKNTLDGNATIIKTEASILDAVELFNAIKKAQKDLYKRYDYVIPLDVDEFLVYDDKGGLGEYLKNTNAELVTCVGKEVIHLPFLEPPLDLNKKWIDQLKYWHNSFKHYGKTLITKKELPWQSGFHTYVGETIPIRISNIDKKLFLIHFHKHNFETTIHRHTRWSEMKWSEDTIKHNHNHHYRQKSIQKIKEWYYAPLLDEKIYAIPEIIKKNIDI